MLFKPSRCSLALFYLFLTPILFLFSCATDSHFGATESAANNSNAAASASDEFTDNLIDDTVTQTDGVPLQLKHLWRATGTILWENLRSVAVGASGAQVFANMDGGATLITANQTAGSPTLWSDNTGGGPRTGKVAAAAMANLYASLHFEGSANGTTVVPRLTFRRSGSSVPFWSKTFDATANFVNGIPSDVYVSRDGSKSIAWWYNPNPSGSAYGIIYIVGYDGNGNQLFSNPLPSSTPPAFGKVDEDLNRIFFLSQLGTMVVNGNTGIGIQLLQSWYYPTTALGVAQYGALAAIGNVSGAIDIYRINGSTLLGGAYTIPALPPYIATNAALSKDGTTLAVAYRSNENLFSLKLKIFSLGASQATEVFSQAFEAGSAYSAYFTKLLISPHGDIVVGSTSGNGGNGIPFPELILVHKVADSWQMQTAELDGTVTDMDWSADQRVLAVVSSTVHVQISNNFANVDLYSINDELSLNGVAHVGTTVNIEQRASAGTPCYLYKSSALLSQFSNQGATGALLLQSPAPIASAIANETGIANFTIPVTTSMLGQTFYLQALTLGNPRRLTQKAVPLVAVP
jgi:hypothetical protein